MFKHPLIEPLLSRSDQLFFLEKSPVKSVQFATGYIMEQRKINLCLISANKETIGQLRAHLQADLQIFYAADVEKAIFLLHSRIIDCIIAGISEKGTVTPEELSVLTTQFPAIPIVGVIKKSFSDKDISFDLACDCGKIGVKHVVPAGNPEKLTEALQLVLSENNLRGGGVKSGRM